MKNLKHINFSDYCIDSCGNVFSLKVNRILAGWVSKEGYRMVSLTDDNGRLNQNVPVHRLVAKEYIPNPHNKPQVNHINGDKEDNNSNNLEWVTGSENTQHANDMGLRTPTHFGEENILPLPDEVIHDWNIGVSTVGMEEEDVHRSCSLLQEGYRVCDVSRMTGYDRRFVQKLRDSEIDRWAYITSTYDFSKIKRKQRTSPETVIKICKMLEDGHGVLEISRELGVDRKLVGNIKGRKFHRNISSSFRF